MSYALSDPSDSCFQQKCQHTHGDHCFQCEELGTVLEEIQVAVEEASFHTKDDHDEATYILGKTQQGPYSCLEGSPAPYSEARPV